VTRLELAWEYDATTDRQITNSWLRAIVWAGSGMRAPLVYVAQGPGPLRAVDLASGRLKWTAKKGSCRTPVAVGNIVLCGGNRGLIRRYVPRSGHIVWERPGTFDEAILMDGAVYSTYDSYPGSLYGNDARTGRSRWSQDLDCPNDEVPCSYAGVAGRSDRVYAAADIGRRGLVYALDARTGERVWSATTIGGNVAFAAPVLTNGKVFVRTVEDSGDQFVFSVEAFDATSGKHLWQSSVGSADDYWNGGYGFFGPLAADGTFVLYTSDDGFLYALDADSGTVRWKVPGIESSVRLAIANGLVWAGDEHDRLVALDLRDGRELWQSGSFGKTPQIGRSATCAPVVAGPYVLCGTSDGRLLAYRAR
jgi:outer membrane protein assembly factor BamB